MGVSSSSCASSAWLWPCLPPMQMQIQPFPSPSHWEAATAMVATIMAATDMAAMAVIDLTGHTGHNLSTAVATITTSTPREYSLAMESSMDKGTDMDIGAHSDRQRIELTKIDKR